MDRVLRVVRIQLVNAWSVLGLPWAVLASAFVVNLAIFAAIGDAAPPEGRVTGALMSIYIVMLVAHLQTMTQLFPFALGLSVTRRDFFAATALVVTAQSLGYGIVLTLLGRLERATGGWWIDLRFFDLPFLVQSNPLLQVLVYAVPFLFLGFLGVFLGVVFKRWGQPGMYVTSIGTVLVLGAVAVLVTWQGWWPAVGGFFAARSAVELFAGLPLLPALLMAGAGFLVIRRATA